MQTSDRLKSLGGGVFARTDQRKQVYRLEAESGDRFPLIDLSLGSADEGVGQTRFRVCRRFRRWIVHDNQRHDRR